MIDDVRRAGARSASAPSQHPGVTHGLRHARPTSARPAGAGGQGSPASPGHAALGDLASLQILYLWGNELSGEIPAELGDLAGPLAYTVSSLLNQLFGKGKEPFWQQAYTNLVRWIIELHRVFPQRWVTLQQVYRCAIDPELFAAKIEAAEKLSDDLNTGTIFVKADVLEAQVTHLAEWEWTVAPGGQQQQAVHTRPLKAKLEELKITHEIVWESGPGKDTRERVEAIKRWFVHDWQNLDNKIKSSIVEGVSVFLSMFDMPDVAKVFCPAAPHITDDPQAIILQAQIKRLKADKDAAADKADPEAEPEPVKAAEAAWVVTEAQPDDKTPDPSTESNQAPTQEEAPVTRHLPPIYQLIEQGKVLALNMPAGINPALARAVGVMLKNAWLQALLMRPAKMKANPGSYFRPAVFICDEYQAFASVGEEDPSGDEKSFALTRQCRCIPIVATQSISSLRAVLGSSEAWRSLRFAAERRRTCCKPSTPATADH